jgi:LIVCS family branched-chain amino acid:cation transporter
MKEKLSWKSTLAIGLMFFALFLGAGNVIFPPLLGQQAGQNLPLALFGFLLAGVGLPLLAIIAVARSGDLMSLAGRAGPVFGVVFSLIIYIMLGPFFGIPRTATVSYEIGIVPFLSEANAEAQWPLMVFAILFFAATLAFALFPAKIVDTIGKVLSPILFLIIIVMTIISLVRPMGEVRDPQEPYIESPVFSGFIEGYLTMDVIAALIIGILITSVYTNIGIKDRPTIVRSMISVALIIGVGLSIVYAALSYIGATSVSAIGMQENGGVVLALASRVLTGELGGLILAVTILLACLTTSIGLVIALSQFFAKLIPAVSYRQFTILFCLAGTVVANVGLTNLIAIALPVLMALYPLAIVLVVLSYFDHLFGRDRLVYITALVGTGASSLFDGLNAAGISVPLVDAVLSYLPLYDLGLGWVLPFAAGTLIGLIIHFRWRRDKYLAKTSLQTVTH